MGSVERGGVIDQGRAFLLDAFALAANMSAEQARDALEKLGIRTVRIGRREWVSSTAFVLAIDSLTQADEPQR